MDAFLSKKKSGDVYHHQQESDLDLSVMPKPIPEKVLAQLQEIQSRMPWLVYYGFSKLTPKIIRKRSILIIYENDNRWSLKKEKAIKQKMHIVAVREQLPQEIEAAQSQNREFTRFEIFVDEKPYKGNLELALERNKIVENVGVTEEEKQIIRDRLRYEFPRFYNDYYMKKMKINPPQSFQEALIFD